MFKQLYISFKSKDPERVVFFKGNITKYICSVALA